MLLSGQAVAEKFVKHRSASWAVGQLVGEDRTNDFLAGRIRLMEISVLIDEFADHLADDPNTS
ncbi:MAG: hypothetical protein M3309_11295, partial [Actinomycetota bacterium]|nr:hypothetical protein [Actinomycetota bacterium]